MPGRPVLSAAIRFGSFEVDPKSGDLRKHGARVKLQEQPLQILQMLLEHPGQVVTREELRQRLWHADTFVDFDHGLYNAIKRLREALGDVADTPRFIETIPKRGYRFIASVTVSEQIATSTPSADEGVSSKNRRPAISLHHVHTIPSSVPGGSGGAGKNGARVTTQLMLLTD